MDGDEVRRRSRQGESYEEDLSSGSDPGNDRGRTGGDAFGKLDLLAGSGAGYRHVAWRGSGTDRVIGSSDHRVIWEIGLSPHRGSIYEGSGAATRRSGSPV